MANNLRTELVLDALTMAIYTRRPQPGLIHHSDRVSQYTSVEFGSRLREKGLLPSMGSVADAYDNSMAEGFVSTLSGVDPPPLVAEPSDSEDGDLRVHRDVLQPSQETLRWAISAPQSTKKLE
jgi:transposase InsO family protein